MASGPGREQQANLTVEQVWSGSLAIRIARLVQHGAQVGTLDWSGLGRGSPLDAERGALQGLNISL